MTIGAAIFLAAVFAYGAFIIGTNLCNYFWQAGVAAGIVFALMFVGLYFEIPVLSIAIPVLFFLALIVALIKRKFR